MFYKFDRESGHFMLTLTGNKVYPSPYTICTFDAISSLIKAEVSLETKEN